MKHKTRPIVLFCSIFLLIVANMNAYGFFFGFGGSEKWKEEVQLSDGRVIVIERETLHERGGAEWASNSSGTTPKERRIRFAHPDGSGKMIEWRSTKTSPHLWPEKPLILDIQSGEPFVFAVVGISEHRCEVYSKYIYHNGGWIEETLPEEFEKRITNLLIRDGRDMPKFVDLETKRKGNAEIGYSRSLRQVGPKLKVCGY